MPISRDPRNDRRRRILRENAQEPNISSKPNTAKSSGGDNRTDGNPSKRSAGYSQDVRRACGARLVELIPVRQTSFLAVIAVSLMLPCVLSVAHYMVYVNSQLNWYGHPLALTLDASYPRSLAAWLTDKLWMLCLGSTILTFQLRRHKLDDYVGDYRLWFWLVLTCLIGSLEASTSFISLFAAALNNWSQTSLGWSGPAVVKATIAVLVAMLGLRLCTELKSAPASVVFMLTGLACWAGSAALAQPEFTIDLSPQIRVWLQATLWLGGLTSIWLSSLCYLRHVYIEAQQRFLSRRRVINHASGIPFKQRLREAMPNFRRRDLTDAPEREPGDKDESLGGRRLGMRMPSLKWLGRKTESSAGTELNRPTRASRADKSSTNQATETAGQNRSQASEQLNKLSMGDRENQPKDRQLDARTQQSTARDSNSQKSSQDRSASDTDESQHDDTPKRRGLLSFMKRKTVDGHDTQLQQSSNVRSRSKPDTDMEKPRRGLTGWLRRPKHSEDAEEYRKVRKQAADQETASNKAAIKPQRDQQSEKDTGEPKTARRWIPRMSRPKLPKFSINKWIPKFRLPKLKMPKLPSLQLKPPTNDSIGVPGEKRSLPSTDSSDAAQLKAARPNTDGDENVARPLTKAERKRLRRMQQQDRAA